jgi:hypothetical protein
MVQSEGEDLTSSALQQKILRIICTKKNVTYKVLMAETKRDRITILQSVESLIKHHLIRKIKSNPEYEKSRLIFKATNTAKEFAHARLGVSLEDIVKIEEDQQVTEYFEFIKDITDSPQRKTLLQPLLDLITSPKAWVSEDTIETGENTLDRRREVLKDSFKESLLELFINEDYNAKGLFNSKNVKWFKKLFTPEEVKEIVGYIRRIVNNANLTMRGLQSSGLG